MSRPIPQDVLAELLAQEMDGGIAALLEITHGVSGYPNPLRIVDNTEAVLYEGEAYEAFPFKYEPPGQREEGETVPARLTFCGVDQRIAAILLSTDIPPVVMAVAAFWRSTLDVQKVASWPLTLRNARGQDGVISVDLIYEESLDFECPALEFRTALFRGLY